MTDTHPADLAALEAAALISSKSLSPVELAEACIERAAALNPAINALVAYDFDQVLDRSREAERQVMRGAELGPLHGVPFGVKDMLDVTGLPTTLGMEALRQNIATRDDAIVRAMRNAGAIPLGKTNNPELSLGGNTINRVYGATGNPHDPTKSSAGSSGGSAAMLGARIAPLATGSDTGGSLRSPAAFCGVVGFRPSPGVVPGDGRAMALTPLPTSGPMARSVADAAIMLSVLARPDRMDPYTIVVDGRTAWDPTDFARLKVRDLSKLRFAVTEDFGFTVTESTVRHAFRKAVSFLAPHLPATDETHPDCSDADRIFAVLRALGMVGHEKYLRDADNRVGPNVRDNVTEALGYGPRDFFDAFAAQGNYHRRWQSFFEKFDFILSPAVTISPRDWRELYPTHVDGVPMQSYYQWLSLAYASTLAGHPSISIPVGKDSTGMPFGLQIIGRRHDDLGTLEVAAAIEAIVAGSGEMSPPRADLTALAGTAPIAGREGFKPDW